MRARRLAFLCLAALALSGCLRTAFDRCADLPPHPECAILDAGVVRADAPLDDGAVEDAPAADAPASDAPAEVDAPIELDAG